MWQSLPLTKFENVIDAHMRRYFTFITISLLLSGCSLLDSSPEGEATVVTTPFKSPKNVSPAEPQNPEVSPETESAEIVWRDNPELADGFIIKSGPEKDSLGAEVRVKKEEVQSQFINSSEAHFRYVLKDIPRGAKLFVSIASFKGDAVSPFSEAREVK